VGVDVLLERRRWAGSVGGVRGFLFAEAFDVDRDGREDVLDVGLRDASVAAAAHLVAVREFVDGALDPGPARVSASPVRVLLVGTVLGLEFVEVTGRKLTVRGAFPLVQEERTGQGVQWAGLNRTTV
jgi:hypothetical protein